MTSSRKSSAPTSISGNRPSANVPGAKNWSMASVLPYSQISEYHARNLPDIDIVTRLSYAEKVGQGR